MAATKYSYTISTDFPANGCNLSAFLDEISNSAIVTAVDTQQSQVTGDTLDLWFRAALSAGDKTILDGDQAGPAGGLIAAHDGTVANGTILRQYSGLDANDTSTVTPALCLVCCTSVIFQVVGKTGTHATHVLKLQHSLDGSNWADVSGGTVTGEGISAVKTLTARYARVKVGTAEGGASTVDVLVQAT